ncbi:hypothetical protein CEXT_370691 [Caerostris extrusa]|uniref:Torsin-1A-interacting protein 1/2 AAA+ activator domain-containing protein n=1 Tax=Caerostris extrusa TaxID=172846 RepID=A0AAV4U4H8_CAEEX|nr:hypothetical protein CEXT_370691 [Caerostris extrusa]
MLSKTTDDNMDLKRRSLHANSNSKKEEKILNVQNLFKNQDQEKKSPSRQNDRLSECSEEENAFQNQAADSPMSKDKSPYSTQQLKQNRRFRDSAHRNENSEDEDLPISSENEQEDSYEREPSVEYSPESYVPENNRSMSESSSSLVLIVVVFSVLCACVIAGFNYTNKEQIPVQNQLETTVLISNLKQEFKDQHKMTFRIIKGALENVLKTEPKAPAIIMLIATNGSESLTNQFALKLANLLLESNNPIVISGMDYKLANSDWAKKEIDDIIQKNLIPGQIGVVLVKDLDLIPGEAALVFHSYCDGENAPFKKSVFLLTVASGKTYDENFGPKIWDKDIHHHLFSAWNRMGTDQLAPLVTRLTVSVAAIRALKE